MYAIVDIETTGRSANNQKVTEIAILIHDGQKIVDEFQSLVNPETFIPYSITQLTGICDEMVANAPKFYEIAKQVFEMTQGHIFVAHNVSFDHGVLSSEYSALGGKFERDTLCTVKLSRKLLPGHLSYSLGKLCLDLDIPINGRHRAYGDAAATTKLLEILIEKARLAGHDDLQQVSKYGIPKTPPLLDIETLKSIPSMHGVYYFYNSQEEIIYVGKANNIRQRVLSHFSDKSLKERTMFELIADIKYVPTGNELVALLLESAEIKRLLPKFNRAQRRKTTSHGLYAFENQDGIIQLVIGQVSSTSIPLKTFHTQNQAKSYLELLVEQNALCGRYGGLEKTKGRCFRSMIDKCDGVCHGQQSPEDYNKRVGELLDVFVIRKDSFYIEESGRHEGEKAVVQISDGHYTGFGFVPLSQISNIDEYPKYITVQKSNPDTERIIQSYLMRHKQIEPKL